MPNYLNSIHDKFDNIDKNLKKTSNIIIDLIITKYENALHKISNNIVKNGFIIYIIINKRLTDIYNIISRKNNNKITNISENTKILGQYQFGSARNVEAEQNIIELLETINKSINELKGILGDTDIKSDIKLIFENFKQNIINLIINFNTFINSDKLKYIFTQNNIEYDEYKINFTGDLELIEQHNKLIEDELVNIDTIIPIDQNTKTYIKNLQKIIRQNKSIFNKYIKYKTKYINKKVN
jgi:hypothetical protein